MHFRTAFCGILAVLSFGAIDLHAAPEAMPVRIVSAPMKGEVPDAEVDAEGVIHIAFVSGDDAYYASSADQGRSWSTPVRINSEPNTVHPPHSFRGPDLAVGAGNRIHVIWYGNGYQRKRPQNEMGVFYSYLDPRAKQFAPTRNLNSRPSDNYSIAADQHGNVAVIWMANGLFVTESSDNGLLFKEAVQVAIADPCECCASRASFLPNGDLAVAYREKANNIRDMHLLRRAPNGLFTKTRISGTPWQIAACPMTGTFLSGREKDVVMAWETKGQICFGHVASSPNQVPKEIKVASRGKWPVALLADNGVTAVSWKDASALHWRLFDKSGNPISDERSQPSTTSTRHAGVLTQEGEFLFID